MPVEGSIKKEKMTIKNECLKCGKCCIVCTDAMLTKEEVASEKYKHQKRNYKGKLNGWSNQILKRKKAYIKELDKDVFMCCYFDPVKKLCTIYNERPMVCRGFDCKKTISPSVHKIWNDVLNKIDSKYAFFEIG